MGQDLETSAALIDRATRNALRAGRRRVGSRRSRFPAFGTGVGGFPLAECARIMIEAIRAHANAATSLRLVRLVLFGQPAYRAFAEVAGELLGPPLDGAARDCRSRVLVVALSTSESIDADLSLRESRYVAA